MKFQDVYGIILTITKRGKEEMIEENMMLIADKMKLAFLRRIFDQVREREGSLSAMEAFSVEVIHDLHEPTIREFAAFLNISQSNATYKVNSLIKKGYIEKHNSITDRREYHLVLTDKYYGYTNTVREYVDKMCQQVEKTFTEDEKKLLSQFLERLATVID